MFRNAVRRVAAPVALRAVATPAKAVVVPRAASGTNANASRCPLRSERARGRVESFASRRQARRGGKGVGGTRLGKFRCLGWYVVARFASFRCGCVPKSKDALSADDAIAATTAVSGPPNISTAAPRKHTQRARLADKGRAYASSLFPVDGV